MKRSPGCSWEKNPKKAPSRHHAFIWALGSSSLLSKQAVKALKDPRNEVVVSAASIWEIAIKERSGKLRIRSPIEEMLEASGFTRLRMTADHAAAGGRLPLHHRDLFDRGAGSPRSR